MTRPIIAGAGMAGLLAANLLRRHRPTVLEAQDALPNNHTALLRFRTNQISLLTGIPFEEVVVSKAIGFANKLYSESTIKHRNLYSEKVTDGYANRSITDLSPAKRWIAPQDFIEQLAASCDIRLSSPLKDVHFQAGAPIISTIPMPSLMNTLISAQEVERVFGKKDSAPKHHSIHVLSFQINKDVPCHIHQTVYFPGSDPAFYRVSITGRTVIAEARTSMLEEVWGEIIKEPYQADSVHLHKIREAAFEVLHTYFGINITHNEINSLIFVQQKYGKIHPIDPAVRKKFIMWATDTKGIYSLGRFATWRPILLDDLPKDIKQIESMMESRDSYNRRLL